MPGAAPRVKVCWPHLWVDATLSAPGIARQPPVCPRSPDRMSDLQPFLDRLVPLLGELEGEPEPLEGGITNRNYRATFAGSEHVIRLPGRDTELLGIDRAAEGAAASAAAEAGIAPPVTALLEDPPCLVCAFVPGRQVTEEDLRGPGLLETLARTLADLHGSRCLGGRVVLGLPGGRGLRGHRARARRDGARRLRAGARVRRADRGGVRRDRRARPGAVPQRPAGRQPAGGRRRPADRGLGVRGHGRPLVRPGQPGGEQRPGRGRGGAAADRLLRRAARRPASAPPWP